MRSQQAPLPSGFGAGTAARDTLGAARLNGKIAIVTGGHAGLGLETTRTLAAAGVTVVIGARNVELARAAVQDIPRVEVARLDLADPASVDAFARGFLETGRALSILINNAGVMAHPLERDARGFESQFAVNHLGHFQLALAVWPALVKARGARIVSLASAAHRRNGVDFEDIHFTKRTYDKWVAYSQSKTANALFAIGADARGEKDGIRAFSVHPGAILTGFMKHLSESEVEGFHGRFRSLEQGAATTVWCAASPQLEGHGGVYCENVDIASAIGGDENGRATGVCPWANDPALAEKLWKISETMIGRKLSV